MFRLGRIKGGGPVGPGLFFVIPCMDDITVMDLRTLTVDIPPQEIMTKDTVTVCVDAVVYYKVVDPMMAVNNVANVDQSTRLLASTTLRTILGSKSLAELLTERVAIAEELMVLLDKGTDPWGIKVRHHFLVIEEYSLV